LRYVYGSSVRKGFCLKGEQSKQFAVVITDSFIISFSGCKVEFLYTLMELFCLFSVYSQAVFEVGKEMYIFRFLQTIKKKERSQILSLFLLCPFKNIGQIKKTGNNKC